MATSGPIDCTMAHAPAERHFSEGRCSFFTPTPAERSRILARLSRRWQAQATKRDASSHAGMITKRDLLPGPGATRAEQSSQITQHGAITLRQIPLRIRCAGATRRPSHPNLRIMFTL
jgi:hypothetical protein